MNHRQLVVQTVIKAQCTGLLWHHCTDSRECQGPRGFPDLFVIGTNGAAFIELKTEDDDTSADQDAWSYLLHKASITWKLFRPHHLLNGMIETFFQEIA